MYIVPQKFGAVVVFCTIEVFIEIRKYHDYRLCTVHVPSSARRSSSREVKWLFGVCKSYEI